MGAFDDEDDSGSEKKTGLKLNNSKSILNSLPKKANPAEFQQKVQNTQDKILGYELEASQLAAMFQKLLEDKTLPENKNILSLEAERELIGKIVDIAIKLNNDENEQEGMGSVGTAILLFRAVLSQKDRINKLEYNRQQDKFEIQQMNKDIKLLEEKIKLLTVDSKKIDE